MRGRNLLASACLLGAPALAGCKLVDARSFDRTADRPPVVHPANAKAAPPARAPLVAIRFPSDHADWSGQLQVAIRLALARKPDVLFTVNSVVRQGADPAAAASAMQHATTDAAEIADAIISDGADRGQVELTAVADPSAHGEEIRVYVR